MVVHGGAFELVNPTTRFPFAIAAPSARSAVSGPVLVDAQIVTRQRMPVDAVRLVEVLTAPAPLGDGVSHVVPVVPFEEVGRVDARRVVAVMTDQPVRPTPMRDEEGQPVCPDVATINPDDAVSLVGPTMRPLPTVLRRTDLSAFPEPLLGGDLVPPFADNRGVAPPFPPLIVLPAVAVTAGPVGAFFDGTSFSAPHLTSVSGGCHNDNTRSGLT